MVRKIDDQNFPPVNYIVTLNSAMEILNYSEWAPRCYEYVCLLECKLFILILRFAALHLFRPIHVLPFRRATWITFSENGKHAVNFSWCELGINQNVFKRSVKAIVSLTSVEFLDTSFQTSETSASPEVKVETKWRTGWRPGSPPAMALSSNSWLEVVKMGCK